MSRRRIEWAALVIGVPALLIVLASATLIDSRPPAVEQVALSRTTETGLALTQNSVSVHFSEPVRQETVVSRFRIRPAIEGTLSWEGDRTLTFSPSRKLPVATDFTITVEPGFIDGSGNPSTAGPTVFTFTTVGLPQLSSTEPTDGADNVPLDGTISLTFDRLMEVERTAAAVQLDPPVPVERIWRGTELLLVPTATLAPGTRYSVRLGPGAADADGNPLAPRAAAAFTTVSVGVGITLTQPTDGAAGSPPGAPIAIVFDRPIRADAIDGALTLTPAAGGQLRALEVPSDVPGELSDGPRALVFQPDGALAPHTTYTVELRAGVVHALDGQAAPGLRWSFTTGSQPDSLENQIAFLSARSGIQNVWAMNPDGTNARQVSAELAPVTSFDVSPDGRTVVYATGGAVRRILLPGGAATTVTATGDLEYAPRLLPDGAGMLVARRSRQTGEDLGWWAVPLPGDLSGARRIATDGAPPPGSAADATEPLPADGSAGPWSSPPAISADGTLALVPAATGELVRIDLVTGEELPTGLERAAGPAVWSPLADAFLAAAVRRTDETKGAWLVPRLGAPTPSRPLKGWPGVSPEGVCGLGGEDGGRLVFWSVGATTPTEVTAAEEFLERQPSFGPAGEAIVFVRVRRDAPDRSAGIWVVRTDGRELRQLSPAGSSPRWIP